MPVFLFKKFHFLMKPMNLEKFTDSYFLPYSFTLQQKHLENCYYMNYRREIKKSVLGTLLVSVVLLIACNADVIDSPLQESAHIQPTKTEVAPTVQKSITVEVNMPSEVKVYSNNGRGYQLVGQYSNIEHSQELSFFAPEDANDFRVSVNGKTLSTTNGGKVKFE
jgi:hypothetical protein